jgi:predicted RNA binding protein YcfA (HicA-like mRNA interferase family)
MSDRPLRYRELYKKLRKFGVIEKSGRGKGSERILYHPDINGRPKFTVVKCHGEGVELSKQVVRIVRDTFNISKKQFYK